MSISLLCRSEVRQEMEAGWRRALSFTDLQIPRTVNFVYHRDKPLSPTLRQFIEFLTEQRPHFQKLFGGSGNERCVPIDFPLKI